MSYSFDGTTKIISVIGVNSFTVADCYSRWVDWVATGDNSKYLQAFAVTGGDPLPGGRFLGTTFFLENGWKIRPREANHSLAVSGNLYSRDGSDPFVSTLGVFNVRVSLTTSNLVDTIATGGGGGLTTEQAAMLLDLFRLHGLDPAAPMTVTPTGRVAGLLQQAFTGDGEVTTTVTRL